MKTEEKNKKEMSRKKNASSKKKIIWITLSIVTVIVLSVAGYLYYYVSSTVKNYNSKIYPETKIESVNVSEMSEDEATEALQAVIDDYSQTKITVTVNKKKYETTLEKLGVSYNLDEIITDAVSYGKDKEMLTQFELIREPIEQSYEIEYTVDEDKLTSFVKQIDKEQKNAPKNATIKISNGNTTVTDDADGYKLNKKDLVTSLNEALDGKTTGSIAVEGKLTKVEADITSEQLKKVTTQIGSFTTNYSMSDPGRNANIRISTEYIDSFLLMPGESFSFNDYVGDTTADKGYQLAGSYLDGQVVSSYGGGVCQVSTTLYNSIITAGIKPDVRYNHSMTVGYVPVGQDAAIAYGWKDLKFTNNFDSPVYIEGKIGTGTVSFNIYSAKGVKPANTEYRLSSEIVETTGVDGYKSITYYETVVNGKVTKKEVISRDTYASKS